MTDAEMEKVLTRRYCDRSWLYPMGPKKVDAKGWVVLARKFGYGLDWIIDWCNCGHVMTHHQSG